MSPEEDVSVFIQNQKSGAKRNLKLKNFHQKKKKFIVDERFQGKKNQNWAQGAFEIERKGLPF